MRVFIFTVSFLKTTFKLLEIVVDLSLVSSFGLDGYAFLCSYFEVVFWKSPRFYT